MPNQVSVWQKCMDIVKLIAVVLAGMVVWLELAQHAEQARRDALFRAVELRSTADAQKFLVDLHTVLHAMLSAHDTTAKAESAANGLSAAATSNSARSAINEVLSEDRQQLREVLAFFSAINGLGSADPCVGAVLQSQFRFEAAQFYAAFNAQKSQLTKILCVNRECTDLSGSPDTIFKSIGALATNTNSTADVCKATDLQLIFYQLFH